ncbi:hypothetical protein GGF37_006380, partial [Kickxella alabastrina]
MHIMFSRLVSATASSVCQRRLVHEAASAAPASAQAATAQRLPGSRPQSTDGSKPRISLSASKFNTSVKTLREVVKHGSSEEVSNRQLFARLQADPNTIDKLDMLGLGSEKRGRFERKKWFRYDEPDVKLPHISFFAGAQVAASFPAASLPEIGFVGRSNVGKSTLVNQICGSSAARVSDKPGMTQQINFYTADNDFHL